ncbi:hypothetical protein [Streptomyces sp. SM8]|uniref:hypothetical protein n=1 Tax=unclassified Streptomyces TaxID=2593676 RepID=UPI0002830BDF|nr:hypothetical protein [Streptomyces sp. SM8]PKA32875.1 hypothetical protein SM8_031905 [Streptomyces sp. SM8]
MSAPESVLLAVAGVTPLLTVGIAALWEQRQAKKPEPAHDPWQCRQCARMRHPAGRALRASSGGIPRQGGPRE